ncbi:MAG: YeeE/YedE family protein [Kangiellaceae bacterium]|jgi:uncharacterized membrane protein YedE/YeeE|nr:YeeE/YedE family protein [Kangiellaceae bacterium]
MTTFDPIFALIGGALLGVSALLLMLYNGKTAGCSGIINTLFSFNTNDGQWRFAFVLGMVASPFVATYWNSNLPESIDSSWTTLMVAAFLVGFGTNLGNGCTSGHGICGIGRLSPRSILATIVFMFFGIAVVFITRHLMS